MKWRLFSIEFISFWGHLPLRSAYFLLSLWHKIIYKNEYIFEYVQECENELWNFNGNLSFVEIYTIKLGEYMMKYEDVQLFNHYCSSVKLLYCHQLEPFHNSLSHYRTYPKMHLFLQMILYHNDNKNTLFVPNPNEHFFLGHPL